MEDYRRVSTSRDTAPRPMGLQDRLTGRSACRLTNYPGTRHTKLMMGDGVLPPMMEEVAQELTAARRRGGTKEPAAGRG